MLTRALDSNVPAAWATADNAYGGDRQLRRDLQRHGVGYVLAVEKSLWVTARPLDGPVRARGMRSIIRQRRSGGEAGRRVHFGPSAQSDRSRRRSPPPQAQAMVEGYVAELNVRLNRWETTKKVAILPRDLTIEHGEITPSLKIKRRGVESNFAAEIDKMYQGTLVEL